LSRIGEFKSAGMISFLQPYLRGVDFIARYTLRWWEVTACFIIGVLFAGFLFFVTPPLAALLAGYLVFTMALVVLIDYRHFIIPDVLSLPAVPLGLVASTSAFPAPVLLDHVAAVLVAGSFLYAIRAIYRRVRGIEGLGLGDVKLAAAAGAWVGLEYLPMTCLLATCAALVAVLARSALTRASETTMTTAIPFGAFIAPAIVIMWTARLLAV
jgi:leader peptidase (prepilin peptidase) / N-methyltransferase